MYKSNLKFKFCDSSIRFKSFEFMEFLLHSCSNIFWCIIVYRPPSNSINDFFNKFSSLLEWLIISPGHLLISGDFNLHVDDKNNKHANRFLDLFDCSNLSVMDCVTPTHKNNHALDLVITRSEEKLVSQYFVHDPVLSDHFAVHCTLATDLSDLCSQYDSVLSSIIDKHAPLRRKSFSVRPIAP